MILGAFNIVGPNHNFPTWRQADGKSLVWDDLEYWKGLARLLESAGFDFLFFADNYGYPVIDGAVPPEVLTEGIMFPTLDPVVIVSALVDATEEIGLVVTSSTMTEHAYGFARRFATLDKLSNGRIGWNIVTGTAQATLSKLFGFDSTMMHGDRYAKADEYVELATRLWETSWEDDAWRNDPAVGLIDPTRVHEVEYSGEYLSTAGMFPVPPTRQRTPVLFQAGTSERGRRFAAQHAEAVFVNPDKIVTVADWSADIRRRAVEAGRDAGDIQLLTSATVIVAPTEAEAIAKREAIEAEYTYDAAAVWFAGFTGIDMRSFAPDEPIPDVSTEEGKSDLERYVSMGKRPTPRQIVEEFLSIGGHDFMFVGTPEQVADKMIETMAASGLDGFMLEPTVGNDVGYREFVESVLPLLREKGAVGPARGGVSLRERLFPGQGDRISVRHPDSPQRMGEDQ
jgi:FMN-dependent oxidoreductase (nitrilotriacetate monooxygenase family)